KRAEVTVAENGQIALDLFTCTADGHFDAILMDIRMPIMDGFSATKAIRSLDRADAKTIPIIAITANAFDTDVEQSI
ncbi:MAG: response regulator, partial [Oscillospiraceae bacterium]